MMVIVSFLRTAPPFGNTVPARFPPVFLDASLRLPLFPVVLLKALSLPSVFTVDLVNGRPKVRGGGRKVLTGVPGLFPGWATGCLPVAKLLR